MRDAYTRHDKWHLAGFLKEIGFAAKAEQEPVSKAEFERVKDNGLRALHPANQQGWYFCRQPNRIYNVAEMYASQLKCRPHMPFLLCLYPQ